MKTILWSSLLALLFSACASLPQNTHTAFDRIQTGVGPEDMVLDTLTLPLTRLLVSCNDHRLREKAPLGDIYTVNLHEVKPVGRILPRRNEPDSLSFHPHGIDLVRQNGKVYLYVVSHDDIKDKHFVLKYEVHASHLDFVATYEHPFMTSPNTVVAFRGGGFYVSNDMKKRGGQLAAFLRLKTGSVIYCDEQDGWATVAPKLSYANGLFITEKERYLYVSTTRQNQLFKYTVLEDRNLINKERVVKVIGGDNIRVGNDNELLIPTHPKVFKFVGHYDDSTKLSPTIVYSVNRTDNKKEVIYANDGSQISAASTALYYKGYYYISQVFQPFILKIKAK